MRSLFATLLAAALVAAAVADSCLEFDPYQDASLQAGDHWNGGLRPPTYGLRMYGLFSNAEYTFTFENEGAFVTFEYNATSVSATLDGTIVGGVDIGGDWATPYLTCQVHYEWHDGYVATQLNEVHWDEANTFGTLDCPGEDTVNLGVRMGHYIKKNHRKSYDNQGRWSFNGWVTHDAFNNRGTRDFLFTLMPCCGPLPGCITPPLGPCAPGGPGNDTDGDGVPDECDNCPTGYNPNQFEWIVEDYDPAGTGFWFSEPLDGRFPGTNCPLVNPGEMRWEAVNGSPVVHFTAEFICGGTRTWLVDFWFLTSENGHHDDWVYYDFLEDEEIYASTLREVYANGTYGEVFYAHQNEVPPMQIGWGANERNDEFGAGGWFFYGLPGGLQYMSDFNLKLTRCPDCPAGTWGLSCEEECTGGASDPCSGQGTCSDGSVGDGSCTCDGGYAGDNCDSPCPAECPSSCLQNGMCPCPAGYFGPGCNMECPGGASNPCNGYGSCDDGPGGLGHCECDDEHWGDDCGSTCDPNCPDTCDSETGGCPECTPGYWGEDCENDCPAGHSMPCMWHGVCDGGRDGDGTCICVAGYWGNLCEQPCPAGCPSSCDPVDGTCNVCDVPGYYGADCDQECPGGLDETCGGHGFCDDGKTGSGSCTCDEGFFGADCSSPCPGGCPSTCNGNTGECPGNCGGENQYGPTCELCPGGGTCSFNGECDWGTSGTGACTCDAGYYGVGCENQCPSTCAFTCNPDGSCPECPMGYYGPDCQGVCAGGAQSPCSWAGACNQGRDGDGTCTCMDYYWGVACENTCPATCVLGICDTQTGVCETCQEGTAGESCNLVCPGLANGQVCSGHGTCNDGVDGDATCTCLTGYSGWDCSVTCPGGAANPCSGNGVCDVVDNSCACEPGWTGWDCSVACASPNCVTCDVNTFECAFDCLEGWAGEDCDIPCGGGAGCGPGTCDITDGTCDCPQGWTGVSCNVTVCPSINCISCTGGSCNGNCAEGYHGENCDQECPGGAATPCNNHGTCTAQGTCENCADGWRGADCGVPCPTGCRSCDQVTGECNGDCRDGYRGDDCLTECPGGAHNPCNNGGTCELDGTCTCDRHHAGDACELPCTVCAVTGFCEEVAGGGSATCVCEDGWTNQPQCDVPECMTLSPCNPAGGVCNDQTAACDCIPGWWGEHCEEECPGGADNPCNGNGVCSPVTGTCTCVGDLTGMDLNTCEKIARDANPDDDNNSTGIIIGSALGLFCISGIIAALLLVRPRDELPAEKEMVFGAQESPPVTPRSKQNTPAATPRASMSSQHVVAPTPPAPPAAPEAPPPEEPPAEQPAAPAPPAAAAAAPAAPDAPPPEEPPAIPPGPSGAEDNRATKAFEPAVSNAVAAAAVGATAAAAAAPADPQAKKRLAKVTPDAVAAGLASKPAPRSFSRPKQRSGSTNSRSSRNSNRSASGTRTPVFGHAHGGSFIDKVPPLSTSSRPLSVGPRSSQSPSPSPRHYRSGMPVEQHFDSIPTVKDAQLKK